MLLLADEYHLGFSRDGFYFSRPPPIPNPGSRAQLNVPPPPGPKLCRPCLTKCDSCATGPGPYRTPFIPQNEPAEEGWSFGNVQTVAGGFVVDESTLRFYFSARSSNAFGNTTAYTGTAVLRRGELAIKLGLSEGWHGLHQRCSADGFASMQTTGGSTTGQLTTRLLRLDAQYIPRDGSAPSLWLNVNASLALKVALLDGDDSPLASATVHPIDSTKTVVRWEGATNSSEVAQALGSGFRLQFRLSGATQLFSFWFSSDACGTSGGPVAAGGPPYTSARDDHCALTSRRQQR